MTDAIDPDSRRNVTVPQSLIEQCFIHFYGLDISNAAIHVAPPRFSPITFRLQEAITETTDRIESDHDTLMATHWLNGLSLATLYAIDHVHDHNGKYKEDMGR